MSAATNLNPGTAIMNIISTDCTSLEATLYFNNKSSADAYFWFLSTADLDDGEAFKDFITNYGITSDADVSLSGLTLSQIYNVKVFVGYYWYAGTWNQNQVCAHNGVLWQCTALTSTDEPGTSGEWQEYSIDNGDTMEEIYDILAAVVDVSIVGFVQGEVEMECPICDPIDVDAPFSEGDCHIWTFQNADDNMTINIWDIKQENQYVTDQSVTAGDEWEWDSTDANGDGAYIVIVTVNAVDTYYYVFDLCGLNTCIKTLIKALLCTENDPCCDSCDPDTQRRNELYRLELNKINLLYFELLLTINSFRLEYLGVNEQPTVAMTAKLTYINNLINKLKQLITRCGDCGNSGNSKPCNC